MNNYKNLEAEEEEDEEINEEQIVQAILELGNDILNNIGVEEKIDDVGVFFSDMFYIQFFQAAFPEIDFSQLEEANNEEEMAENIQALIDLLGSQILKYDLSHISGKEIVSGNPEHCINLLQLVQEISLMMENKEEGGGGLANQLMDDEDDEEDDGHRGQQSSNKKGSHQKGDEDDEAEIIHERRRQAQQQQESNSKQNSRIHEQKAPSAQKNQSSQKRGRSYSDDRSKPAFEMDDDFADQLEMDMHNVDGQDDDDEDDEEAEMQMMQQMQQQQQMLQQQQKQQQMMQQQQQQQQYADDDEEMDDNEEDEYDEEDINMYNQLLANQQQQMAQGKAPSPQHQEDEDEDENGQQQFQDDEDDDMEDLDPELVAAAQQMGLNPAQIRQLQQQLQSQGYGDEDGEDMESYYSEGEMQTRIKLLKQKSYSAPYIMIGDCYDEPLYDNESQRELQKACSTTMLQNLELKEQSGEQDGEDEDEMDEQELMALHQQQQMLMQQQQQQQQHSKITEASKSKESSSYAHNNKQKQQVQSDDMNLYYQQQQEKAQSVNQSKQSSQQKKPHQKQHVIDEDDEDGIEINMAEKLQQLQEQQQQQQQYQNFDGEDEYGEEDEEDEQAMMQQIQQQQMMMQQQQQMHGGNQHQQHDQEDDEDDEDEEDKTLIELDDLDEKDKEMLLQYLQQEYEKNPDQFPFPQELLQGNFKLQQQSHSQKEESIRDIKSEEMIVEDAQHQYMQQDGEDEDEEEMDDDQIMGGEQQIEDDPNQQMDGEDEDEDQQVELTEEQQMQLQQLLMMQQQQMQQQDQDDDENYQQQLHAQYVQMKPKKAKKGKSTGRPKSAGKRKGRVNNLENIDPNMYQQQVRMPMTMQGSRPISAKTGVKKRPSTGKVRKPVGVSNLKLQPYKMPKLNVKVLQPSTPGTHFKSYTTNRSQTLSKKKKKRSASKPPRQQMLIQQEEVMQDQVPMEMPVLSEEFLNQLSEEQLQALLEHQQQLMLMQQQQQLQQQMQQQQQIQQQSTITKKTRPKSGKKTVPKMVGLTRAQIYGTSQQPYMQRKKSLTSTKTKKKKTKKSTKNNLLQNQNGVILNNFFPALEGGQHMVNGQMGTQDSEDGGNSGSYKDQKYPKFSNENINGNANYMELDQEAIDEVPQEQEEAESQEHFKHNFYPQQQQQMMDQDQAQMMQHHMQQMQEDEGEDQDDEAMQDTDEQIELTEEQLAQLVQNAHNLSPEQQQQLQMILQEKMREDQGVSGRAQSYENIYSILMDNVKRAKDRLAHLGDSDQRKDLDEDTDRRILKQKMEFDALLNEYLHENKVKEARKTYDEEKIQKQVMREQKIQAIKEKKFEEDLVNQQKSLMYKRNAQQVRLCQKVYKLASELEKNKLLQEKKEFREVQSRKNAQKKMMVDAIETYYKDRITMLKERIQSERFERKIAQQAQTQALAKMKKELNNQKKNEINKYLQLLKQEDQKYDFESTNVQKIEQEIIKLYKK